MRSLRALKRADVALLLVDAVEGITAQDTHIAGMIQEEGAATIVLVNKWDAVEKDSFTLNEVTATVRQALNFMPYVPLLFISAATGQRVHQILPLVKEVEEARYIRIPTGELNRLLREALAKQPPPGRHGKPLRFYYATQVAVAPPAFVFFVNDPTLVHFSYERYLENQIRTHYPFAGSPMKLYFRGREQREPGK
jgi:GTP-binding protein